VINRSTKINAHRSNGDGRDFDYEAKTCCKYLNVGRKYRLHCLVSLILTSATGIGYLLLQGNLMSSFLRSKTWYIIPTRNRDMVSLSSSYDEEKRIFNQHHYGTAYEIDLLRRDLLIMRPTTSDGMQTCIVFEI